MKSSKEVITECFEYLNPKSVLDLGCGDGKFTMKFAKQGINVTGVDKGKKDLSQPNFNFIQMDIRDFEFTNKYDLIFTSMVLHFLKKDEAIKILEKIKKSTLRKGHNFLICMSNEDDSAKRNPSDFYPGVEELNKSYSDWEIIKNEICLSKEHEHKNSTLHRHKIIIFLARKKK